MNPKVYPVDEHRISPDRVDTHAIHVIQKLRQAGYSAYLVGGGVRDLLLNQRPKDFDISTSASPEEIKRVFRNCILIGRRFRLAHVRFGQKVIEVSTFRTGDVESAELIVRDNEWGSEEEDVRRRDFTINGLFYDPESQTVIDYVGGFPDIERRLLRTIGPAEARFTQDPVRMIRLLKFCARFQLQIDPSAHEALLSCRGEITKSSPARVLEELLRMLESGFAAPFFRLLQEYGLLEALLPELSKTLGKQPEHSIYRLLAEMDDEVKRSQTVPDRSLLVASLLYPMLESELKREVEVSQEVPHLGTVSEWTQDLIDDLFEHFFQLPRKLRGMVSFLLTTQFRFTPLDGKTVQRPRLPRDTLTPLALQLFKLRASVDPSLLSAYTTWTEAQFHSHVSHRKARAQS